jgi:DNA repair exonuclease SbcCD ATPase subunit
MALFVAGKKTKPGTAGLSAAELRLRRRNATRTEDPPPAEAPSTVEALLAEREELQNSLRTAQTVQKQAIALTERLEKRFAAEKKKLEEAIQSLKEREKSLEEANQKYKNDLEQAIENYQRSSTEKAELEERLQTTQNDYENTKQSLQCVVEEQCCKIAELEKLNEEKQQSIESLESNVSSMSGAIQQMKEESESQRQAIQILKSANAKLQDDLLAERQTSSSAQEECNELKSRFVDAETNAEKALAEMRKRLEEEVDARRAMELVENERKNEVTKLLKDVEQKEKRIQELEALLKAKVHTRPTVSQKMSQLQPDAGAEPDAPITFNQNNSDSIVTERKSPVKKRTSKSLPEGRKRNSGFNTESFMVKPKRRSFSPSKRGNDSSSFHWNDLLVDRQPSRSSFLAKRSPNHSNRSPDDRSQLTPEKRSRSANRSPRKLNIHDKFGILVSQNHSASKSLLSAAPQPMHGKGSSPRAQTESTSSSPT